MRVVSARLRSERAALFGDDSVPDYLDAVVRTLVGRFSGQFLQDLGARI